ncbi:efflux RND transporter periplasmic adaptor subunit [Paenibacillus sp. N4]|uniref:efflux RND transporter periplasmic adaptor subunit n=1 Tax=Paenibacillus vietnamensis TaxID=2590547 RepID=UPI001CD0A9DF|nr:efflux RND transporter periplasmic adaptor subunit [Paenibacillus vietnamensis]MCA0757506.1 efflux RND transporter periplasmic adaptor subunit [Paenibacillus vietnamensis]
MKRWALWIGVVIVLAAAGSGVYYYYFMRGEAAAVQTSTSRTVQAGRSDIEVKISGSGTVNADSRATVTAGTNGTIEKLGFKAGDKVKKGQVLAAFEMEDVSIQIRQLELNMKKQELQMTQYETQYKEATGTENEAETKQSLTNSMELLKLDIEQNRQSLDDLYEQQEETLQVVAPIDGTVTASDIEAGDEVQGSAVIAEIVNYEALTFVVQVDELDIPDLKLDQTAKVHLNALPDKVYEGKVVDIAKEGTASNGVAAYDVTVSLTDIDGIIAGMSGSIDIVIESKQDVVVVPADAVVEMRGATYVRVPGAAGAQGAADGAQQGTAGAQGAAGGAQQGAAGAQGAAGGTRQGATGAQGAAGGQRTNGAAAGGNTARAGGMQMEGQLVAVEVGISDETYVEIVSGLKEGDSVLVPLPQGTVGTAAAQTQTQIMAPGGFGGMGGQFPGGGMGGGGVRGGTGGAVRTQGGGQ